MSDGDRRQAWQTEGVTNLEAGSLGAVAGSYPEVHIQAAEEGRPVGKAQPRAVASRQLQSIQ